MEGKIWQSTYHRWNQRTTKEEKIEEKMIFLFLALNMFILKVDVKLLGLGIIYDF